MASSLIIARSLDWIPQLKKEKLDLSISKKHHNLNWSQESSHGIEEGAVFKKDGNSKPE